jgi:hypothetical protein
VRLVKHCKKEHNIFTNSEAKLQLGSLYYYRSIEDPDIRDEEEGIFIYKITAGEHEALTFEASNLLFGEINQGQYYEEVFKHRGTTKLVVEKSQTLEFSHFPGPDGKPIFYISRCDGTITRELFDTYIFCMSIDDGTDEAKFSEYDDSWSIPIEDAGKLSRAIAISIATQAPISSWKGLQEAATLIPDGKTVIETRHGNVHYMNKSVVVDGSDNAAVLNLINRVNDSAFTKPPSYLNDKEYRFIFMVNRDSYAYEPADSFLRVDVLRNFNMAT